MGAERYLHEGISKMVKANKSNKLKVKSYYGTARESLKTVKNYDESSYSQSVLKLSPSYVFKKGKDGKIP